MTFEEFVNKVNDYMQLDTLDGYLEAKKLVATAHEKFIEPKELEKIGDISSSIMLYSGELLARESSSISSTYDDFDDNDDDDNVVVVRARKK
jgi:hypothetical protein